MKTLEQQIQEQKDLMEMKEIGHDMYYSSPEYKEDLAVLRCLENKQNNIFDPLQEEINKMLKVIAEVMGQDEADIISGYGYADIDTYFRNCEREKIKHEKLMAEMMDSFDDMFSGNSLKGGSWGYITLPNVSSK